LLSNIIITNCYPVGIFITTVGIFITTNCYPVDKQSSLSESGCEHFSRPSFLKGDHMIVMCVILEKIDWKRAGEEGKRIPE